jgi:hypothetical protein
MRIAVSSQNFRTITGHAGKSRRFIVYHAKPGETPQELERLDLPKHSPCTSTTATITRCSAWAWTP